MLLWTLKLGPEGKKQYFHLWKCDSCRFKPARKTYTGFLFSLLQWQLWLSICAQQKWLLVTSSLEVIWSTASSNLSNNRYGIQHSQNTLLDLFSHGMVECPSCLYKSLFPLVNMFCEPGNYALMIKPLFSPVKDGYLQPHTARKTH